MLLPPRGIAASGFPPLCNIPHCCLPQESGPCLSSSVADHPLRPAMRHSLGKPLPHQLTDTIQADPLAELTFPYYTYVQQEYEVLAVVSNCYPSPRGTLPIHYSPVRHLADTYFPRRFNKPFSFDLHVLSMPPAFTLSQDQTLHKKNSLVILKLKKITLRTKLQFFTRI